MGHESADTDRQWTVSVNMKSNLSFRHGALAAFLTATLMLPISAHAFSLATLVEAHQERMQQRYERMSHRLCNVVSTLLPFVASDDWCVSKEGKYGMPEERIEPLIIEGIPDSGTSTTL